MSENKNKLPTLAELHHDVEIAFKHDQFNMLMNQPPHEKWVKKHPILKTKGDDGKTTAWRYIPVDKIEFMLTRIFGEWRREILSVFPLFNSVCAHIRLHVKHPLTGEWTYHDGTGACPIQTDKDHSASDMSAIKSGAVQMAAPAAVSYALKDAAECFGKLFGKDLNKRDTMMFKGAYEKEDDEQQKQETSKTNPKQQEEDDQL